MGRRKTSGEYAKEMELLARYALPGLNYNEKLASEFYRVQKQFQKARKREISNIKPSTPESSNEVFINGFGEATTREITSAAYKAQQKKLSKEMLQRLGK